MISEMERDLDRAWRFRQERGLLKLEEGATSRLFYGPGEVNPSSSLSSWAIDGYGSFLWITEWEDSDMPPGSVADIRQATEQFFSSKGFRGAVILRRPKRALPEKSEPLWGDLPPEFFVVSEGSLEKKMHFEIRLLSVRHPGLFLDHQPLRQWLAGSGMLAKKSVLNTFSYTGSLSVAAWVGGASSVTTLDLSKSTIQWAERNAQLNEIAPEASRFIFGDFFEEVPRLARKSESYDVVICDPPSFSRGSKRTFSTQKDLILLHELLMSVLRPGGILISSINSANVPWHKYERDVLEAAKKCARSLKLIQKIEQPLSFPYRLENPKSRYLKGFIFQS